MNSDLAHRLKRIFVQIEDYESIIILSLIALPLGIAIGLIEVVFAKGLELSTNMRLEHVVLCTAFLPVAGLIIAFVYATHGKNAAGGMGLVFEASRKKEEIPKRLAPLVMCSSWLTHLCGGSAGREGVAVQIGATIADQIGQRLRIRNCRETLIICGIAAGFASLFQTPFAAIFFSLEVLVCGELKYKSLFPAIVAAFSGYFTAHEFGLEKFYYYIPPEELTLTLTLKLIALGIIFAAAGVIFSESLKHTKRLLTRKIPNPLLRIFICGSILSVLFILLYNGRYSGFGTNITLAALTGDEIYYWDWILKLLLTVATLSVGFQGGELTPLFSIGASLGAVIAAPFGLPFDFVAALGFTALFGSATNTFLAPILIGAECFGTNNLSSTVVVCAVAFFSNFGRSIYGSQKQLRI